METRFLLPASFKKTGWAFIAIGALIMLVNGFYDQGIPFLDNIPVFAFLSEGAFDGSSSTKAFSFIKDENFTFEVYTLLLIIGSVMVAFSRHKNEDEFISKLRLESLVWATYVQYVLLAISILFIYGLPFVHIMIWNLFTMLLLFIAKFNFEIYRTNKALKHEEQH